MASLWHKDFFPQLYFICLVCCVFAAFWFCDKSQHFSVQPGFYEAETQFGHFKYSNICHWVLHKKSNESVGENLKQIWHFILVWYFQYVFLYFYAFFVNLIFWCTRLIFFLAVVEWGDGTPHIWKYRIQILNF